MNPDNIAKQVLEQLSQSFSDAQAMGDEVQGHLRAAMMSTFSKLDLVTREEFDAQRVVLMRSREKIESLELQLAQLEEALSKK